MQKSLYSVAAVVLTCIQVLALMTALEKPAQAYVDPGSGLLAFQILGSMIAGAAYYLRARLARCYARLFSHPEASVSVDSAHNSRLLGKRL